MAVFTIDPERYEAQLAGKLADFRAQFAALDVPAPEVFRSAPQHYRMRAEFRLWHHDQGIDYAMFEVDGGAKKVVLVRDFPALARPITQCMPRLRALVEEDPLLRQRLFQVEFLATLSGEVLVSLVYHRKLDADWQAAARKLAAELGVLVIGRSRGQKIVLDRDWVEEKFIVDGRELVYRQIEGSFTQPNAGVNQHMLGWARHQAGERGGDLLELYCGNGNFTIALAPAFDKVLATEVSKTSVLAAHHNLAANGVENVCLVRMSSAEISDALGGGRAYRRLREIALERYRFSTLFVDPPRCGLDEVTLALARKFERVIYVSCNPATLRDDLAVLADSHHVSAAAVFDQFPYTPHLECGMVLERHGIDG